MSDFSKFQDQVAVCLELEGMAQRLLASGPRTSTTFQRVAFAFASKSAKTYIGVVQLARQGLGEPALMLVRSLFEDLVNLTYIGTDQNRLADLFIEYEVIEKKRYLTNLEKLAQANKKYEPTLIELREEWRRELEETYQKVRPNYPIARCWSGKTLRQMVNVDPDLLEFYFTLFTYTSGFAHGDSILALESYVRPIGAGGLESLAGPSDTEVATALALGFTVFNRCLRIFARACGLKAEGWTELEKAGREVFAEIL